MFYRCLSVCQTFPLLGRHLPRHTQVYTPLDRHLPLWANTYPGRHPPHANTPLGRHPLGRHPLEQTLPRQTLPWADPLPQDGHCRRQYASYWNAFLFNYLFIVLPFFPKRVVVIYLLVCVYSQMSTGP